MGLHTYGRDARQATVLQKGMKDDGPYMWYRCDLDQPQVLLHSCRSWKHPLEDIASVAGRADRV